MLHGDPFALISVAEFPEIRKLVPVRIVGLRTVQRHLKGIDRVRFTEEEILSRIGDRRRVDAHDPGGRGRRAAAILIIFDRQGDVIGPALLVGMLDHFPIRFLAITEFPVMG